MSTISSQSDPNKPWNFVPSENVPNYDLFVTEDGKPVDSFYSERQMRLLTDALFASWKLSGEGREHIVASDVGLFYSVNKPPLVPDVFVSMDVTPPKNPWLKKYRSYYTWEYGKSPEMVVEIVSNKEGGELSTKLLDYARVGGIIYYVVWDPECHLSATRLHCFALTGKKYVPSEAWFPEMELGVTTWQGSYDGMANTWLRWCDRNGVVLATGVERAQTAEHRAESAEERAKILEAKLRAMGVDPSQP